MPTPVRPSAHAQRGTSAVEFTLVAVPMLLVGLGTLELSRWFFVKQAISLALLEAGRAGITDHARPASIERAFEHALLPLFPPTATQNAAQRQQRAFTRRRNTTGASPWQIRVVAPDAAAFHDFSSSGARVAGAEGLAVIDNNYQAEQHQRHQAQGWHGGRGPASGVTIFDANSLELSLTYMHEPLVPGMRALMALLSQGSQGYARAALAGGYLPMRHMLRLTMQSHPVAWPNTHAKVFTGTDAAPAFMPVHTDCRGIWCNKAGPSLSGAPPAPQPGMPPTLDPLNPSSGTSNGPSPPTGGPGAQTGQPVAPAPEHIGLPDELACGVVLCCTKG